MPLVSVILNSYNQSAYLVEAVESVLGQTYHDFELIVMDNGSTDESPQLLRRYEADARVRLFLHHENTAITRRFNQAVALARGEYVSFLYSDDYYLPTKLERQVALFAELPPDYGVVYGPGKGFNVVTGRTWTYGSIAASGNILRDMFRNYERGQIDMISPLVRKTCLERYPFHEDIFAEGEAIYFRLALTTKFFFHDEPLAVIRDHTHNAGKALKWNADMSMRSLERLADHPDFPVGSRDDAIRYKAAVLRNFGWQAMRVGGDVAWGRSCFSRAVRTEWRQALHHRLIAGLVLSLLPAALRSRLNGLGNALRRVHVNSVHVENVGGSVKSLTGDQA